MKDLEIGKHLRFISYPENYLNVEEMEALLEIIKKRKIKKDSSYIMLWILVRCALEQAIERAKESTKKKTRKKKK